MVPADARCQACRYPLRGLSSQRCPECGRAFDPADPSTLWPHRRPPGPLGRWWVRQNGTPTVVWAIVTVIAAVGLRSISDFDWDGSLTPFVIGIACLIGAGVRAPLREGAVRRYPAISRPRRLSQPARRRAVLGLLSGTIAVGAAGSAVLHVCPHGTQCGIFGVGLAHSAVGGPCRNAVQRSESQHLVGDWYLWWG